MRIDRIEVTNFKQLRHFDTGPLPDGIIGITGPNGQGKSTLLNAIAYALYGPGTLETGTADAITWGDRKCSVLLQFSIGDAHYSLRRSQDKSTSMAELYDRETNNQLSYGPKEVNGYIEWLLGIDIVGFQASVFSRQDDLLGLGALQASKRVSTMLRLLGIDQIDKAIKWSNEKRKEHSTELDLIRRSIEAVPDLDVEAIARQLSDLDEEQPELEHRLAQVTAERDEALDTRDALFETYERWVHFQNRLSGLNAKLGSLTLSAAQDTDLLEPVPPVRPDTYLDPAKYAERAHEYTLRINSLRQTMDKLICPTCGRPIENISEDHFVKEQHDLEEMLKGIEADAPLATASAAHDRAVQNYKTVQLPRWNEAQTRLRASEKAIAAVKAEIEDLTTGQEVEDPSAKYQKASAQYTLLNTDVTTITGRINSIERERALLQEQVDRFNKIMATQADNIKQAKVLESEVVEYATCSSELASFKSEMVSGVIPALSERASEVIAHVTEGKYSEVNLTSQYDIQYKPVDLDEFKSFPNLSGGEKNSFAMALRLAIADLRASAIGVLVLDEIFERLDDDRQESTWKYLEQMATRFSQIFLVTHVGSFKDRAPFTIAL